AYRGLRIDDFERFVGFFVAAGYDLNAKDAQGNDFIALIQDQRFAEPYIEVIKAARG
uniref:PA4642 family protein n=2 Tax=Pseudomonas TaxID=286 RepID=UPI004053FD9E